MYKVRVHLSKTEQDKIIYIDDFIFICMFVYIHIFYI